MPYVDAVVFLNSVFSSTQGEKKENMHGDGARVFNLRETDFPTTVQIGQISVKTGGFSCISVCNAIINMTGP